MTTSDVESTTTRHLLPSGRARVALAALAGFVAVTAVGGGIALATRAETDRFPADLLEGTPFTSYLIPGLILAVVVGGSAAVATAATLRRPADGAWASLLAGVVMMGWIVGEVLILAPSARSWIEAVYFALGLVMAGLALALGRAQLRD
jgi:hypothetical protein